MIDWIKCSDSLPANDVLVLIAMKHGGVYMGYRSAHDEDPIWADGDSESFWWDCDSLPVKNEHVTHWAHLPAHPEDA